MSIKNLFDKPVSSKTLTQKSLASISNDVESPEYVKAYEIQKERFAPDIDFSKPANFAKYGSAEQYYTDSISRVHLTYPFDGSRKEVIEWHNSSSFLDNWIFEKRYPRTNGHVILTPGSWGVPASTSGQGFGTPATADMEYIQIKGGPNAGPSGSYVGANIYSVSDFRESNLRFGGIKGNTVEFWLKANVPATSTKQVIFDLWNGEAVSHAAASQYGRFTIYLDGTISGDTSPFKVTCVSGTVSVCTAQELGSSDGTMSTGSVLADTWNHYAVSIDNDSTALRLRLHLNGELNDTRSIAAGAINEVTGALIANIGALRAKAVPAEAPAAINGSGKLSGSLDEFRFWKRVQTSKQVGRNWFTQVGGGTNTDTSNTDLGVYFKFNEGIVGSATTDSIVLDYSGRISHGQWVGYNSSSVASRQTTSAIVIASASATEFQDPILYSAHSDVSALTTELTNLGKEHDLTNNSSIFTTMPEWIVGEDQEKDGNNLLKLTQIVSSFYDDLHLQIETLPHVADAKYMTGSAKPIPFAGELLKSSGFVAPEIFIDASVLNRFAARDEERNFEQKLYDIKNLIYINIYNNLSYIYKSKGTEKAFRNLIRCYGVDDELIRLNLYGDNITHEINSNYRTTSTRKKFVDFNNTDRFVGTVYQYPETANANSVGYVSGSMLDGEAREKAMSFTVEAEVILPKKFANDSSLYFETPFVSSSLFGAHSPQTASYTETSWEVVNGDDIASFQVYALRAEQESKEVKFVLSGSSGSAIPVLTSSFYSEQYDNQKWNLAVRFRPLQEPFANRASGTLSPEYNVEFYGVNTILDEVQEEFLVTSSISYAAGNGFMCSPKRMYAGAHYTNFTGSLLSYSDAKISGIRAWMSYLDDATLRLHAADTTTFGTAHPLRNTYLFPTSLDDIEIPQIETLVLHWDFANVTASAAGTGLLTSDAKFTVADVSSGSVDLAGRHGWLSDLTSIQHTARGDFFIGLDTQVVDTEYIYTAKQKPPEVLDGSSMIEILEQDDEKFTRESRPVQYFWAIEKSMYQTITDEMLNFFAAVTDFNNLIGEPVNRYRQDYKALGKLRQLFFDKVQNTPDIQKYIDFYRWIDSSMSQMIQQLVPASANFSEEIRNIIESHVLERNKYWTKYPTLEMKTPDPVVGAVSINKHKYNYASGSAPIDLAQKNEHGTWWKHRANREKYPFKVSDEVDNSRALIHTASLSTLERKWTTPYDFVGAIQVTSSDSINPISIDNVKRNLTASYFHFVTASQIENTSAIYSASIRVPNYRSTRPYEIVQTSGRSINNRAFVVSGGIDQDNSGLDTISTYLSGVYGYAKVRRGAHKHIFVERFSAPGGPETAGDSDGGPGLDRQSATFSVYNSLNYRNLMVRTPLQELLTKHQGQFGVDSSESTRALDYNTSASYHKVHRNTQDRIVLSGSSSGVYSTASLNDNWYVSHPIPSNDLGYRWIRASAITASFGHTAAKDGITFVSASTTGSFAGYDSASLGTDYHVEGAYNAFLNNREGPYEYPSWKQIRVGERNVPRYWKKNNIITIEAQPLEEGVVKSGERRITKPKRSGKILSYIESPASNKYKPLIHSLVTEVNDKLSNVVLKNTYGNNLATFATTALINRLGTAIYDKQIHDKIVNQYTIERGKEENSIKDFNTFIYEETIFPKETNMYLNKIRTRSQYSSWWTSDTRSERHKTGTTNSQGYVVTQSNWGLDGRLNHTSSATQTGSFAGEGELQNNYTVFFGNSTTDENLDRGMMGDTNPVVVRFNNQDDYTAAAKSAADMDDYQDNVVFGGEGQLEKYIGPTGTGAFSISAWINVTSSWRTVATQPPQQTIVELGTGDRRFVLTTGSTPTTRKLQFQATDGLSPRASWFTNANAVNEDTWYHVAVTYTSSIDPAVDPPTFYVNAVAWTLITEENTPGADADTILLSGNIGSSSIGAYPFEGMMSDVSIFNKKLSSGEVFEIYNGGVPQSLYRFSAVDSLVSWHRLGGGLGFMTGSIVGAGSYMSYIRERGDLLKDGTDTTSILISVYDKQEDDATNTAYETYYNPIYDVAGLGSYGVGGAWHGTASLAMNRNRSFVYGHGLSGAAEVRDSSWINDFKVGCLYSRPAIEYIGEPWPTKTITTAVGVRNVRTTGSYRFAGDTKWTAGIESGKFPTFTDYEKYISDIKYSAKEYSLVPEFRISEHMVEYLDAHGGNFLKKKNDILTLTGSSLVDSSQDDFYKTFSHSDFLKYFDVFSAQHKNIETEKEIRLKCNAFMKFIPYEGFYPQQRTRQLATLLSQSYSESIVTIKGSTSGDTQASNTTHTSKLGWRAFFTPFFAPGILYNSIKSGIACDYPMYSGQKAPRIIEDYRSGIGDMDIYETSSYNAADNPDVVRVILDKRRNQSNLWLTSRGIYGSVISASVNRFVAQGALGSPTTTALPVDFLYLDDPRYTLLKDVGIFTGDNPITNDGSASWNSCFTDDFSFRMPFEGILEPESYLSKRVVWDMNPEQSASVQNNLAKDDSNYGCLWSGNGSISYKLATHNFVAETPSFFLKDKKMTSFVSKPVPREGIRISEEDKNSFFAMDVYMTNSKIRSYTDYYLRRRETQFEGKVNTNFENIVNRKYRITDLEMDNIKGIHTQMFSRDSAFGPGWSYNDLIFTGSDRAIHYHYSYEPFTPSYFNGLGQARMVFFPFKGAGNYTLEEIQNNLTMSYYRMPTNRTGIYGEYLINTLLEHKCLSGIDENIFANSNVEEDIVKASTWLFTKRNRFRMKEYVSSHLFKTFESASNNWMNLDSSINLLGKSNTGKITFEKGTFDNYELQTTEKNSSDSESVWTIQTKWETPVLNFKNKDLDLPLYGSESISKGMWLQNGDIPTAAEGIYFGISDLPKTKISSVTTKTKYEYNTPLEERSENTIRTKKTNGYVLLHIFNWSLLSSGDNVKYRVIGSDGTAILSEDHNYGALATSGNYSTAKAIADNINSGNRYDEWPTTFWITASAYIPEDVPGASPGVNVSGSQIASVKIELKDIESVMSLNDVEVSTFFPENDYSSYKKTSFGFPNYHLSGERGKKHFVECDVVPGAWSLEGADASGNRKSGNKEIFSYNATSPSFEAKSLADLVGFQKQDKKIGTIADEKLVKEAVVAIPFIETNNQKKFFSISRRLIDLASARNKPREDEQLPGQSIIDMTSKMKDFVIPPTFDFLTNRSIDPFAMYIFEFSHKFSQQDLKDIWQNLPPSEITDSFKTQEVSIQHELLENEILNGRNSKNMRWMIFKVKQKASWNYFAKTADTSDDDRFKFTFNIGAGGSQKEFVPDYSYNWPYDFFSMVELIKLDAKLTINSVEEPEEGSDERRSKDIARLTRAHREHLSTAERKKKIEEDKHQARIAQLTRATRGSRR